MSLVSLKGTCRGEDIFNALVDSVNMHSLSWSRLTGITTYEAPSRIGSSAGVVARVKAKLLQEERKQDITAYIGKPWFLGLCI